VAPLDERHVVNEPRHVLTITPGIPGGFKWNGHILFDDGTETTVYGSERVHVIARAQEAVEQFHAATEVGPEVLILDHAGEIVREPDEWSVKA
jgi:hypothetical protein